MHNNILKPDFSGEVDSEIADSGQKTVKFMDSFNNVSLVIPVLNEEGNITKLLASIPKKINEVIVVDNGSTDQTINFCRGSGARVIYEARRGYGAALRTGILEAQGDIIVCMDGDNSYPPASIQEFLTKLIEESYDFVSGERISTNPDSMPLINKISNKFISSLIRNILRIKLQDSQSGMWAFRKKLLQDIMPIDVGMGFSQEIKIRAYLNRGIKCCEIKIPYGPRSQGRSKFRKFRDSVKVLRNFVGLTLENR